jgi:hypothetical protein
MEKFVSSAYGLRRVAFERAIPSLRNVLPVHKCSLLLTFVKRLLKFRVHSAAERVANAIRIGNYERPRTDRWGSTSSRLIPHPSKIETMSGQKDQDGLLHAMAWEDYRRQCFEADAELK